MIDFYRIVGQYLFLNPISLVSQQMVSFTELWLNILRLFSTNENTSTDLSLPISVRSRLAEGNSYILAGPLGSSLDRNRFPDSRSRTADQSFNPHHQVSDAPLIEAQMRNPMQGIAHSKNFT